MPVRWAVGLLAVAAAAAVAWSALGPDDDGEYASTLTPAASSGDVVPPAEEDADQVAAPGASEPTQDVIPPAEQ